ncbi:hypothetical protein IWQ61_007934 [Dispira simplex]|nr:hypothetical protein IWQ61_007934 [Dispira simplex]
MATQISEYELFHQIRDTLDQHYDRRERLIKLSRDIIQQSKKLIFHLLRSNATNRDRIFAEAEKRHQDILTLLVRAAPELQRSNRWRYASNITGGLQEYIEAMALWWFLRDKVLITIDDIETQLNSLLPDLTQSRWVVLPNDYVLGVADVGGELMRHAINSLAKGDPNEALQIGTFLQLLCNDFETLTGPGQREAHKKLVILRQCLAKVETACFQAQLQREEYGDKVDLTLWAEEVSADVPTSSYYVDFRGDNHTAQGHWNDPPKTIFRTQKKATMDQPADTQSPTTADSTSVPDGSSPDPTKLKTRVVQWLSALDSKSLTGMNKRKLDDANKKMTVFYERVDKGIIPSVVLRDLERILGYVEQKDFAQANAAYIPLIQQQVETEGKWLLGLKRLMELQQAV